MGGGALILIDTHALIWLDQNDPALGRHSRELADEALNDGTLAVSAMSFWEIAMLVVKGRITKDIDLKRWRLDLIGSGLVELPLDGGIGITAAQLSDLHGDPADRFILATALANDATLLTADRQLLDWPGTLQRHDARL
jgi:PIN domain nuclease of toxin-antitoxin system